MNQGSPLKLWPCPGSRRRDCTPSGQAEHLLVSLCHATHLKSCLVAASGVQLPTTTLPMEAFLLADTWLKPRFAEWCVWNESLSQRVSQASQPGSFMLRSVEANLKAGATSAGAEKRPSLEFHHNIYEAMVWLKNSKSNCLIQSHNSYMSQLGVGAITLRNDKPLR